MPRSPSTQTPRHLPSSISLMFYHPPPVRHFHQSLPLPPALAKHSFLLLAEQPSFTELISTLALPLQPRHRILLSPKRTHHLLPTLEHTQRAHHLLDRHKAETLHHTACPALQQVPARVCKCCLRCVHVLKSSDRKFTLVFPAFVWAASLVVTLQVLRPRGQALRLSNRLRFLRLPLVQVRNRHYVRLLRTRP